VTLIKSPVTYLVFLNHWTKRQLQNSDYYWIYVFSPLFMVTHKSPESTFPGGTPGPLCLGVLNNTDGQVCHKPAVFSPSPALVEDTLLPNWLSKAPHPYFMNVVNAP